MNKILSLLIAFILALSFSACNKDEIANDNIIPVDKNKISSVDNKRLEHRLSFLHFTENYLNLRELWLEGDRSIYLKGLILDNWRELTEEEKDSGVLTNYDDIEEVVKHESFSVKFGNIDPDLSDFTIVIAAKYSTGEYRLFLEDYKAVYKNGQWELQSFNYRNEELEKN